MSDLLTPWGYKLLNTESLPNFITDTEFDSYTNNKFHGDARIAANIPSATRSIQNYCGWHIYPSLTCEMVYRVLDLRDSFVGSDLLIQLPATLVSEVSSILLNAKQNGVQWEGDEVTDFDIETSGIVRIYDVSGVDRRSKIRIVFNAGLPDAQMDLLKELTANRVVHAVTSSYGITSESAGGVSVTYNASWSGNARSTALPDDNKEILNPYRVKGVF
jgi:hypothetical protein